MVRSAGQASLETYSARLVDRLDALMRSQAAANITGRVGLHALIADQLLRYRIREGERVRLEGPAIWFRPWSGQVMALAVHELACNAIEHGALGQDGGLDVSWGLDGSALSFTWRESGEVAPPRLSATGFGTEMLRAVLVEEFAATARCDPSASGFTWQISWRWTEQLGFPVESE